MGRLTRDGTAEPVSPNQILRRERGQGNSHFPCSADHVQDWQPYPFDPYSCYMRDHTYSPLCFVFFLHPIDYRATYNFSPRFFRPQNFHIFVVVFSVLPFATIMALKSKHKKHYDIIRLAKSGEFSFYNKHLVPCHLFGACVFSHIQRIGCQPEKITLHGGQPRSWPTEQGGKTRDVSTCLGATQVSVRLASVQGFLRLVG